MLLLGPIGFPEMLLILGLVLLLFGPKKLPEMGRALGKGLREFKKGTSEIMDSINMDAPESGGQKQTAQPQPQPRLKAPAPKPADQDVDAVVIDVENEKGEIKS